MVETKDVKALHEVTDYEVANEYLKLGWVLLDKYKTCYDPVVAADDQTMHFVLAWIQEGEPERPASKFEGLFFK